MSEPASPQPGANDFAPFSHNPTSARVPERVARGVVSTGCLAFFSANEFVIDFLQQMGKPQLVARVILPPVVAEQLVNLLRESMHRHGSQFGATPPISKPSPTERPRSAQEIYDDLKIPDDILCGVYANNVLVSYSQAEFGIDFLTTFLPNAAVSARVFLAAPRMVQLIDTLGGLVNQYKLQRSSHPPLNPPHPSPQNPPHDNPPGFGTAPGIPGFPTPPS